MHRCHHRQGLQTDFNTTNSSMIGILFTNKNAAAKKTPMQQLSLGMICIIITTQKMLPPAPTINKKQLILCLIGIIISKRNTTATNVRAFKKKQQQNCKTTHKKFNQFQINSRENNSLGVAQLRVTSCFFCFCLNNLIRLIIKMFCLKIKNWINYKFLLTSFGYSQKH